MNKLVSLSMLIVVALIASACSQIGSLIGASGPAAELVETHTFTGFGYSIDHPEGWQTHVAGSVSILSETEEDHINALAGDAVPLTGYQIVFDHRSMTFMRGLGLPDDPTLQDLLELNTRFFGWQEPLDVTETSAFGAPALQVRNQDENRAGVSLLGFANDEAYLMGLDAPSEESLEQFMPTWNNMLESIEPVAE